MLAKRELRDRLMGGAAAGAILLMAGYSTQAVAQEAEEAAIPMEGIGVITVVGQKVEENLQEAELAVSAVEEDLLEKANITDPSQLTGYVPGLLINKSGGAERMVSIRGVGQGTPENVMTQPGVAFHIDGSYIPNSIALNMGFFDVDRVEVLRGPQGTVFGQSSTGGAINVLTKQPELGVFGGEVKTTVGDYSYVQGYGAVNVPIGDSIAIRGAVQKTAHDGYATATEVGAGDYELDDADNLHYKLAGKWAVTDDLDITLSRTHYEDEHNGSAQKLLTDPNPNIRELTQDFPAKFDMSSDLTLGVVTYDLPFATLKSVTSYFEIDHDQSWDSDRSDVANFGGYDHTAAWSTTNETFMQEVTLSSLPGVTLEWIAGIFYTTSDTTQYVVEYRDTGNPPELPVLPRSTSPSAVPANLAYENESLIERKSWAPFVQFTYNITDDFRAIAGARYNIDSWEGWGSDYYAPRDSRSYESKTWTGKAGLAYDLTDTNMLYGHWSRGYKPGGINTGTSSAMVVKDTFEEEIVDSYEIGSKNRFFDDTLGINVSAFYSFYDNMQYIQEDPVPYAGGIGNIAETEIWGMELESTWLTFNRQLELGVTATILDGEVKSDDPALDRRLADAAGNAAAATGTIFPWTGPWFAARQAATTAVQGNEPANLANTLNLHATWYNDIADFGELTARAEYLYRGKFQSRVFNTPGADQVPSYDQVNLFVGFDPYQYDWYINASLTNVFDEEGISGRFVDPYGSGTVSNEYIPPRLLLVTVGYKF